MSSKALAQLTKGLAAFAAAIWFDWRLTIGALIVAPVMAVVLRHLGRRIRKGTRLALQAQEDLLRASNEAIQGIRAVKTARAEGPADRRFGDANQAVLDEELRVRTARAISSPLVELLAVFVLIGLAIFACREIIAGRLTFDSFMLSLASLGVAAGSLRPLVGLVNEIQAASARPNDSRSCSRNRTSSPRRRRRRRCRDTPPPSSSTTSSTAIRGPTSGRSMA